MVGGGCVVRGPDELEAGDGVGVLRESDEAKSRKKLVLFVILRRALLRLFVPCAALHEPIEH